MERFTQRARRVLSLSQEEAERMHHAYIGTEHLLLGLLREEGGVAGRVLRELGVETKRVQEMVERLTGAGKTTPALIGYPGGGKPPIVGGLAQRIVAGETPEPLLGKRVLQLDVGSLVA